MRNQFKKISYPRSPGLRALPRENLSGPVWANGPLGPLVTVAGRSLGEVGDFCVISDW